MASIVDAKHQSIESYLENSFLTNGVLANIPTRHSFFIVDSCYAGTLFENIRGSYEVLNNKPSRWAFTSGRKEVVPDGPPGTHSPFAEMLFQCLTNNSREILPVGRLIADVKDNILKLKQQNPAIKIPLPMGGRLIQVGDEGGEFVFRLKTIPNYAIDSVESKPPYTFQELLQPKLTSLTQEITKELLVKGDVFYMGAEGDKINIFPDEQPLHRVELSDFWIDEHPVTNFQFSSFLNEVGNKLKGGEFWYKINGGDAGIGLENGFFICHQGREKDPVTYVSWHGALAYAKWLGEKTGKSYRLPTEAEWEYLLADGSSGYDKRGYKKAEWLGGNIDEIEEYAWYSKNSQGKIHPVKQKLRSPFLAVYDTVGNVWEWCVDRYLNYASEYQCDPYLDLATELLSEDTIEKLSKLEIENSLRVVRGGCFKDDPRYLRISSRGCCKSNDRLRTVGFRLARSI